MGQRREKEAKQSFAGYRPFPSWSLGTRLKCFTKPELGTEIKTLLYSGSQALSYLPVPKLQLGNPISRQSSSFV
jgi:hypothetical protein